MATRTESRGETVMRTAAESGMGTGVGSKMGTGAETETSMGTAMRLERGREGKESFGIRYIMIEAE